MKKTELKTSKFRSHTTVVGKLISISIFSFKKIKFEVSFWKIYTKNKQLCELILEHKT